MLIGSSRSGLEAEDDGGGGEGEGEGEGEDEEEEMKILVALRRIGLGDAEEVTPDDSDIKSRKWQRKGRYDGEMRRRRGGLTGDWSRRKWGITGVWVLGAGSFAAGISGNEKCAKEMRKCTKEMRKCTKEMKMANRVGWSLVTPIYRG